MIVPMKKVALIIKGDKKTETLSELRKLGILQIEIHEGSGEKLEKLKAKQAMLENAFFSLQEKKQKKVEAIDVDISEANAIAKEIVSLGNQTGEGWFLTGEMLELIHNGAPNIVCTQPFACLPNHVVGKGVIKELRRRHPEANIVAIDYDPGASEVNQLNRIKLMLSTANKRMEGK